MAETKKVEDVNEEVVVEEPTQEVDYKQEYEKLANAYSDIAAKFNRLLTVYNTLLENYINGK